MLFSLSSFSDKMKQTAGQNQEEKKEEALVILFTSISKL